MTCGPATLSLARSAIHQALYHTHAWREDNLDSLFVSSEQSEAVSAATGLLRTAEKCLQEVYDAIYS